MPLHVMSCVTISIGILLPLLTITHQANTNFTITPSQQVVGVGQDAVFRCRHRNITFISWRVNETIIVFEGNPGPSGITAGRTLDPSGTVIDFTLTIIAQPIYNETEIVCTATFPAGNVPNEETVSVNLTIQGPLSMVTDIKSDSSTITWKAPFSLDLTRVDPDIVYCVEVYNITCGVDDLVVGDCDVTEPRFVDNRLQQGYIYRIIITPRTNGQDAQNGASNIKEEMFTSLTDARSIIMFTNRSMVTATFQFRNEGTGVEAASYSLILNTIDETERLTSAKIFTQNANNTNVSVVQSLPRRRLWNYQVLALNCIQYPVTSLLELSTHDFQSVAVSSPSPGLVRVTGDFINGSSATSILAIIYLTDNRNDVYYMISSPFTAEETLVTNISGLASGLYNVSVFVLEENGLPFNRSASTPRSVLVGEHQGDENGNYLINYYEVLSTSGVCITCTFLDSSTTGCVAVVHQRISQLSSSGLMNIESSHKFNRSGDTAIGCIEGVNLEQYHVGVVGERQIISMQGQSQSALIAGITSSVVAIVIIVVVVVVLLMWKQIRKRQVIHTQQQQQQPGDSSSLKPLTTPPGKAQDEEAYDVLRGPPKTSASKQEGGVPSAAIYSVLDKNPPQSVNPPQSGVLYSSVKLAPSGVMGHDDLHKTTTPYSELQQHKPQEEESLKGPGNTYAVTRIDTVTSGDVLSDFNDEVVYIFNSAQEYVIPSELTTFLLEDDDDDSTCLLSGEYHPSVGSTGVNNNK